MATFTVKGPFTVPVASLKAGKHISTNEAKAFWGQHSAMASERGCYVFAFRAGKGIKPVYIGKATKSFGQEAFAPHKLNKYNQGLANQGKGTPVLFFVCLPKAKGKVNRSAIDDAESFLIQSGLTANKALLNSKKTRQELWGIRGVVRGGSGKPSAAATELCQCLNL